MLDDIREASSKVENDVSQVVYGHREATGLIFGAMVIGGHVLLEGPPGIAKTLLAKTFSHSLGLNFRRIQFTPDLMPSDITGVNIYEQKSGEFKFCPGPIFSDVVLADEINRTPPKTQAALLEAMEESQTTIDGDIHRLSDSFFVIATQNPLEHEGTFPLPEAQLDRFLFRIRLSYGSESSEKEMILKMSSEYFDKGNEMSLLTNRSNDIAANLPGMRRALRSVRVSPELVGYIYDLSDASRKHDSLALGASPRAALNLTLASKYNAVLNDRDYVIPDDVQEMAIPVLNHRLIMNHQAFDIEQGTDQIIRGLLERTPIPA